MTEKEKEEKLKKLYRYLERNMEDLPPDIYEIVNEHFWQFF